MTPRDLVRLWSRRVALTAAACALAAGLGALGAVRFLGAMGGLAPATSWTLAALASGLVAGAEGWRRLRGALTPARVALWLEERAPALQYALVTAVEGRDVDGWCARRVRSVDVATPATRALRRSLAGPAGVAALGAVALLAASGATGGPGPRAAARARAGGSPLRAVRARVVPPAYAARATEDVEDPATLRPLVGSRLELSGPAEGTVTATVDATPTPVVVDDTHWTVRLTVDSAAHLVRLSHDTTSRLAVVMPVADSLPSVAMALPARDTVLRAARGSVRLAARATDDLGLASAAFEYIVSSGEGERFTFRSGTIGARDGGGRREVALGAVLDLSALQLGPGDVVHLRAVARDRNAVGGPGIGASDTRTLRIARAGEYDSVAVEPAAPPEVEASVLSQRMLITLAEALVRRARSLDAATVVTESRRIARDQARLRKQVSDLVFSRLGDAPLGEHFHGDGHDHAAAEPLRRDLTPQEVLAAAERATGGGAAALDNDQDETPIVAVNRPLLEAYNAMWDAGRELDVGRPRAALPSMYAALAAIQKARAAERLYLRGTPPRVVVDLAKARLAGKDRGTDAWRAPSASLPPWRRDALVRLERALATRPASAAADSLLVLRLALVGRVADLAPLDELAARVRRGDVGQAMAVPARRLISGAVTTGDAMAPWGALPRD